MLEGILTCENQTCQREYPIIDGVPILIRDLRNYLAANVFQVCQSREFTSEIESILNDCCGPGSAYDTTRQHLSSYTWDHYGEFDPLEPAEGFRPGSLTRLLSLGLELGNIDSASPPTVNSGPILDVGCSVGRTTLELASRFARPTLGVDMNFAMLRSAAEILRTKQVRYPRRRIGVVYDQRSFPVPFEHIDDVDFWACDGADLPFEDASFGLMVGLNTLDCVHSPLDFLTSLSRVGANESDLVLACPYDWSPSATPIENWLGGHSQRGLDQGAAEPILRRLIQDSLERFTIVGEKETQWQVRLHERSLMQYQAHLVAARRSG